VYLIAGLGNPGRKYQQTRHNLGFLVLRSLAARHQIPVEKRKFECLYGSGEILGKKVLLLTPLTYMNLSGLGIASFLKYYQLSPQNLIVIHDELDLPWTTMRIADKGGAAGNKGVLSVIDQLQTREFIRLRLGIGRPPENIPADAYVLSPFTDQESKELPALCQRAGDAVEVIIDQGLTAAKNRFNVRKKSPDG
jgi:PTH1 family peptidyl-tRNA hydrolase